MYHLLWFLHVRPAKELTVMVIDLCTKKKFGRPCVSDVRLLLCEYVVQLFALSDGNLTLITAI